MPKSRKIAVHDLVIDLNNLRTVPQATEIDEINAIISINPEWFWALTDSLISDGYLLTENIIVIEKEISGENSFLVREGNRRVSALKLIHGYLNIDDFPTPNDIKEKIANISDQWKNDNYKVPCSVFKQEENATVDKIVSLVHGKGEKAGRDTWTPVARARHNRDFNKQNEFGLDLLDKYLKHGKNLTGQQKDRWSGVYHLSILDEAIRKLAVRLGFLNTNELVTSYPKVNNRDGLEEIIKDIGLEILTFKIIRDQNKDFALDYGFPVVNQQTNNTTGNSNQNNGNSSSTNNNPSTPNQQTTQPTPIKIPVTPPATQKSPKSLPINDPKAVVRRLKHFMPKGKNREKVVSLKDEASKLDITKTPIAFCFILRSMFEISAKLYCSENNLKVTNSNGQDKKLVELLRDATNHLTNNKQNMGMVKTLHGAMTELAKNDGILSVTSMNQLVHNTTFTIIPRDICVLFANVYPLLEAMN